MINYYCLRAVGEENELKRFFEDRVIITESGKMFFNLNSGPKPPTVLEAESEYLGSVKLYKTTYGRLLMLETNYIKSFYEEDNLIFDLQKQFPSLKCHYICSYCDFSCGEFHHFTKIKNGEICIGDDGLPKIETFSRDLNDDIPWYDFYDYENPRSKLASELDNNVGNLRMMKLREIFKKPNRSNLNL